MTEIVKLTQAQVMLLARQLASSLDLSGTDLVWGVPRGGVPVAMALAAFANCGVAKAPEHATVIVDDLCDSATTRNRYRREYPNAEFGVLIDKHLQEEFQNKWIQFPWEVTEDDKDESATDIIERLLQYIGEDPTREGLKDTPVRVLKAWREWCIGYGQNPADVLTTFEDGATHCNELIIMRSIPIWSVCEHHLAPFFGTATIGYIPNGRIVGLSKLVRLANIFARRLQVQERLSNQIVDALMEHLHSIGAGVIIECRHLCMESRGVCTPGTVTTTSALRGALFEDQRARAEFLSLRNNMT